MTLATWIPIAISTLALVISLVSLIWTLWGTPGTVTALPPLGYALIRGISPHPSDHLVIPMDWQNTGSRPVLIRDLALRLRETSTNTEHLYVLVGEYANISSSAFQEPYTLLHSFSLPGHSVTTRALVFRPEQAWDQDSVNYTLRLEAHERYLVRADYWEGAELRLGKYHFTLPVFAVNSIPSSGTQNWEYWTLDRSF